MNSDVADRRSGSRAGTLPTRPRTRQVCASLFGLFLLSAAACGMEPTPAPSTGTATLATVVVSGEQPGPGLWKVSHDDHVLWILGTLSPLPKGMTWVSRDIEATIARSQEVILPPGADLDVKGGMLRGILLLPSLLAARNNPEDARLVDVLPAELHARWRALKDRYIGRDNGIEKRRPIFAAQELFIRAIERSGMSMDDTIGKAVRKAARRHHRVVVEPRVELRVESPGAALREWRKSSLDDLECFAMTLARLETDIDAMKLRANAWASGDIEALRSLRFDDQLRACSDAVLNASVVEQRGLGNIRERVSAAWLEAAERALLRNEVSFAMLPMRHLLEPGGLLSALEQRGYRIEAPE
jgi:uncharacterized protein YbaP (TraB family)